MADNPPCVCICYFTQDIVITEVVVVVVDFANPLPFDDLKENNVFLTAFAFVVFILTFALIG